MNLMRQRDELVKMHECEVLSAEQLKMALEAPVFQWWCGEKREFSDLEWDFMKQSFIEEHEVTISDGTKTSAVFPKVRPYECFRISHMDTPIFEQWFIGEDRCFCARCDDRYSDSRVVMYSVHFTHRGGSWFKIWMWFNGVKAEGEEAVWRAKNIRTEMDKEALNHFYILPMKTLTYFLFDIYSRASSVVKVSPDQPGRSVQWRLAREHYLVLRRKDARQLQATGRPPTEGDLVRSAHWRIAHVRRLVSNKFVNKRGLIVPVKEAWVGPKEWKGKDGKIYTVVGFNAPGLK